MASETCKSPLEPPPLPLWWRLLEAVFDRVYRLEPLEDDPEALLACTLFTYRGPEVRLRCGTTVRRGDRVMEIHFRRQALCGLGTGADPNRLGLALRTQVDRDLPRLARALRDDPRFGEVTALHALTLFHRGIDRYGFEVMPLKEWHLRLWFTGWHRLLMARDHPGGFRRVLTHRKRLVTQHVWISRKALIRRYFPG